MILGYSAYGYTESGNPTPTSISNINKITLENCIVDDLYCTQDINISLSPSIVEEWDYNTVLHATFDGTLLAGNVDWSINEIDAIRIRYREVGTTKWTLLTDVPISSVDDLSFIRYLKYARGGGTEYQVALIPIMSNGSIEGNYNINTVVSDFNGMFIMDADNTYHLINVSISPTHHQNSSVIETLDGKYPIIIHNTSMNYYQLSIQGMFIQYYNKEYLKSSAYQYRAKAEDFLCNGYPKILKYHDGRMWLADISDSITDDESKYTAEGYTLVNFVMTEIGDPTDTETLYNNGLISINTDYGY